MVVTQNSDTFVHGSYLLRSISAYEVRTASCLVKSCIKAILHECGLTSQWTVLRIFILDPPAPLTSQQWTVWMCKWTVAKQPLEKLIARLVRMR